MRVFLIAFLLLPLLVVAASALFGWLIALANTKMRNKNVIMMVLTLILFMAYMYVCLRLQYYLQKLIENGSAIGEAIQKALPPFLLFRKIHNRWRRGRIPDLSGLLYRAVLHWYITYCPEVSSK